MKSKVFSIMFIAILLTSIMGVDLVAGSSLKLPNEPTGPLDGAFTYQGQLQNNGQPVTDSCDLIFELWDATSSGVQIGNIQTINAVSVVEGYFTVELNDVGQFGAHPFQGDARYLEVKVRCPEGSGNYTSLGRQGLTATPYAHYALKSPWSGLSDVPAGFADGVDHNTTYSAGTGLVLDRGEFSIAEAILLPSGCADGGIAEWDSRGRRWVCGVDDSGAGGTYWSLGGNVATDPNTNYMGTSDAVSLTLRVDGTTAFRLEPTSGTPNVIGGASTNAIDAGIAGVTISGGSANTVGASGATIGGGSSNDARGDVATISGGSLNSANGTLAVVGGGMNNIANGYYATVAGGGSNTVGFGNEVTDDGGTISGGTNNQAGDDAGTTSDATYATVGGGENNVVQAEYGTIAGGGDSESYDGNLVTDDHGAIGGGNKNQAGDDAGTQDDAQYATVSGGFFNSAVGGHSFVGGGYGNTASDHYATVAGGTINIAAGGASTVGGGDHNEVNDFAGTIAGGYYNDAGSDDGDPHNASYATVGGGETNSARGKYSTVGGGENNIASGDHATINGGKANFASGDYSFANGLKASAYNQGCFVWSDSVDDYTSCNVDNRWVARASGGVYFYTNAASSTGAYLAAGSGTWSSVSDRNIKENLVSVDSASVLKKVVEMPITSWNYIDEKEGVQHIGPMAQDFYAAFSLGDSETHITTIDADGVALAAIQGLYDQNQQLEIRLATLESQQTSPVHTVNTWLLLAVGVLLGIVGVRGVDEIRRRRAQ